MRREHRLALHGRERLLQAVARLHPLARALERQERDVALVHVPHLGVDPERPQRPHPADPEHDLLAQAHLAPAHVEHAGDRAVRRVVERDVGVEHQHRHQADLHLPDRRLHHAAGQVDRHRQDASRRRLHRQHRQPREVVVGIGVLLEAVGVHRLAEVAGAVEQAHAHERHAEVARRLAVVARQDTQAARVDAERLVDPELHREIGDRAVELRALLREPARAAAVVVERLHHVAVQADELRVGQKPHPLLRLDVDQQLDRVVVAAPGFGVDAREEPCRARRPAPPVVVGQVAQPLDAGRKLDVGHVQRADRQAFQVCLARAVGEWRVRRLFSERRDYTNST